MEYLIVSEVKVTVPRFTRSSVFQQNCYTRGMICPDADEEYFGSCDI